MDTKFIISLRGKEQCGVAYVTAGGDRTHIKIKPHGGISLEGATVYCLTAEGASEGQLDHLFSALINSANNVTAVAVAKQPGGPFIMEGAVRGAQLDMEQVKRDLRMQAMNEHTAERSNGGVELKSAEKDSGLAERPKSAADLQQKKGAAAKSAQKEGARPGNANRAAKEACGQSANAGPPALSGKTPVSECGGSKGASRQSSGSVGSAPVCDNTRGHFARKPEDMATYAVVDGKEPLYPPGTVVPLYEEAKAGSAALNQIMLKARELFVYPDQQARAPAAEKENAGKQRSLDGAVPRIKRANHGTRVKRHDEQWLKETEEMLEGRRVSQRQNPPCAVVFDGIGRTQPAYNPFPDAFPRSVWKRVSYPGSRHYYMEGEAMKDGARFIIHAIPGEFSSQAPLRHKGFTRFMRAADGVGYWLRIRRRE